MEGHLLKKKIVRSKKWRAVEGDFPRLVYCLLVASVDSWGMMPADGPTLKANLGPFDTHDPVEYEAAIQELIRCDLVATWPHQDDPWLYVVNHDEEQARGIKSRKAAPDVPRPASVVSGQHPVAPKTQQGESRATEVEVEVDSEVEVEVDSEDCESETPEPTTQDFLDRYEGNDLIEKTLTSIASTRKSNKISASVRQGILAKWNKCSVEAVMAGCKTYLESNYASTGKDEKYLWGIIRGKEREIASAPVNTVEIDPEIVEVLTRLRNAHAKDGGYEIHGEVTQNMTSARIALVLDKYGEDGCLQIQRGHIAKGGNDFTSWPGAYPHVAGNASEPNWDWIAGFHKVGGKKQKKWKPGCGP